MPQYGLCLRVTNTGKAGDSIHVSDIRDGVDLLASFRKAGPVYVPHPDKGGIAVLVYSGDVAVSFESGGIRKFIEGGYLTAEFVVGVTLAPVLGVPVEVLDEGVSLTAGVTALDFAGAGVTATNVGSVVTVTIPGGGGGGDHAALANLGWPVSGHTGTASRIAAFDVGGAASYVQVGVDLQAWDTDLDALAALATTGLLVRTGAGTATTRSIVQPAAGITVIDGDGVAGDPTLALADDLAALEALAGTGIAVRTAANTWAERTLTGTLNRITVTNGDGVAGNPTLDVGSNVLVSGDAAGGDLSGTYPNPTVDDGADSTAIHDNIAGEILAVAVKAVPVGADVLLIEDSADANNKKRITVGTLPTGGGGEANTASNVGTAGVGVFKQKTGIDLEFKRINAASTKVTITDDVGNDEVDVDVADASTTQAGAIEIATQAEVDGLTDTTRAVTAATLANYPRISGGATGALTGGVLTPVAATANFNIAAGTGRIVDAYTDPANPTAQIITWGALGPTAALNIGTTEGNYVFVTSAGAVLQLDIADPTDVAPEFKRDNIFVGIIGHPGNAIIQSSFGTRQPAVAVGNLLEDLADAIGPFSMGGNHIDPVGVTQTLARTDGVAFCYGSQAPDSKNPSIVQTPAATPSTIGVASQFNVFAPGTIGNSGGITEPPTDVYDDGIGPNPVTIPGAGSWVTARIWHNPVLNVLIYQCSQFTYANEAAAVEGFPNEDFTLPSVIPKGAYIAAVLIHVDGTTDLSTASIIQQSKFSGTGGGGGGGGGQTNTVVGSLGITNVGTNVDADLAPTYGTTANTVTEGNDARLSDARTPTAHAVSHENGGSDEISVAGLSGLLADGQTPTLHAATHQDGGTDEIAVAVPAAAAIPKADVSGTLDAWISAASETVVGIMETATIAEVNTGTDAGRAVSPASLSGSTLAGDVTTNNAKVTNATHTGDVTGATVLTIAANAVTNGMLADVATATFKGRVTAALGDPEDLTGTQATTLLDPFTSLLQGVVPASGGVATDFLSADGTWSVPPGGGGGVTNTVVGSLGITNVGTNTDADLTPTYGAIASTVTEGNDARLSDARVPTGAAGGELGGTYPNPTVNDGADGSAIHDDVASEISAVAVKVTPASGDFILIEDSAAGNAKKRITVGTLPTGGGGEANTGSNVNVAGVGVFKQKTGIDLEFRGINAASAKATVVLDAGNNEIDIDVADASETQAGAIEIATQLEVDGLADTTRAIVPATLAGSILAGDVTTNNAKVTNATHTGDVAGATVLTIGANKVLNTMLADVATATFKGRITAALGDPEDLTGTQATTLLDLFSPTLQGVVPLSGGVATDFLSADGTWSVPTGSGESNTGSNVNVGGVGVFKQKTGTDLEFRGINAASAKVTVVLDAGNNEIDVDVVDASLTQAGAIELATQAEVDAGVSTTLAVTPATLAGTPLSQKRTTTTTAINVVLVAADLGKVVLLTAGSNATLPAPGTVGDGWWVDIKEAGNSSLSDIVPSAAENIDGAAASLSLSKYEGRTMVTDGTDWWSI